MSYMSPEVKLRALAIANATLQADLGTNPFRWFNQQLNQNTIGNVGNGACVTATRVGSIRNYNMGGLMPLSQPRLQLDVYDLDSETARSVAADVIAFMETANLSDVYNHCVCYLTNQMQRMLPNPQSPAGPIWVQMLEYRIFNDEAATAGHS